MFSYPLDAPSPLSTRGFGWKSDDWRRIWKLCFILLFLLLRVKRMWWIDREFFATSSVFLLSLFGGCKGQLKNNFNVILRPCLRASCLKQISDKKVSYKFELLKPPHLLMFFFYFTSVNGKNKLYDDDC